MASNAPTRIVDVERQLQNDEVRWKRIYLLVIFATLFIGVVAFPRGLTAYPLALLLLGLTCLASFLRPVIGIYLLVFLSLMGENVTMEWWPFLKNMSSKESILYVSDSLILTPFELVAATTVVAWLFHGLVDPTWRFVRGRMFWPVAVFTCFVFVGVLYGKATGGDSRVATFEFRPLLYIPIIYVLVTNLFTTRRQYWRLMLFSLVAVAIQSVFALVYYGGLPDTERAVLESLTEHSATVHMNAVIVFTICAWLFHTRGWVRWLGLVLSVPTVYAYILSQRRAAMVALFAGVMMILVTLYIRRRRAFWILAPTLAVLLSGLVLATWNAAGPIGLPAQAVKSVLFPNQLGAAESGSDQYRIIENYDLWYTIRAKPLTGFGFGQQFLRPIPLPDISFFEFWEYMSHNSVLWIWVKMGFFGFVSMLFMIGRSIQLGARTVVAASTPEQAAVAVTAVSYVIMFLVFAYVDIAWLGGRTTIFLAFAFAVCGDFVGAIDDPARRASGIHTHQLASLAR